MEILAVLDPENILQIVEDMTTIEDQALDKVGIVTKIDTRTVNIVVSATKIDTMEVLALPIEIVIHILVRIVHTVTTIPIPDLNQSLDLRMIIQPGEQNTSHQDPDMMILIVSDQSSTLPSLTLNRVNFGR